MLQMHSRQPAVLDMSGFTNSTCKPFTKNKERIQKLKACFELVMAYGDFKDLSRRTASHKILPDKAVNIVKNYK